MRIDENFCYDSSTIVNNSQQFVRLEIRNHSLWLCRLLISIVDSLMMWLDHGMCLIKSAMIPQQFSSILNNSQQFEKSIFQKIIKSYAKYFRSFLSIPESPKSPNHRFSWISKKLASCRDTAGNSNFKSDRDADNSVRTCSRPLTVNFQILPLILKSQDRSPSENTTPFSVSVLLHPKGFSFFTYCW